MSLNFRRSDPGASLGVIIVAFPLSLGFALASGASPAAGIIAAVIGGIVVGRVCGAPRMVSGPAVGLTALVNAIVQSVGIVGLAIATVLAGFLQLGLGALRAGRLFMLLPKPALSGTLAGIGFVILLGQVHALLGAPNPRRAQAASATLPGSLGALAEGEAKALSATDLWLVALAKNPGVALTGKAFA